MLRDEIGPVGVADDEIVNLLRAEADAVEAIARGDPAPLEFAFEIMRGDRPAFEPDDANRNREQDQQAESGKHADPAPAGSASDDQRPLVALPLGHGSY